MTEETYTEKIFREFRDGLKYGTETRRGSLAEIRRVGLDRLDPSRMDIGSMLLNNDAQRVFQRLKVSQENDWQLPRLTAVLSVLANIREKSGKNTIQRLRNSNDREYSERRFLRLIRMETPVDIWNNGRRIVHLLNREADPGALGADLYHWGPAVRNKWAFTFFSAADALPIDTNSGETS